METLDKLFRHCAQVNEDAIEEGYNEHILVVKNILKYPEKMFEFQKLLSKWESRGNSKPGIGSLQLPYWTANYIGEELIRQLEDEDVFMAPNASTSEFYYFYHNNICLDASIDTLISNNCVLPHTDPSDDGMCMIGLINLNNRPVRTGFWKYKGSLIEYDEEIAQDYTNYAANINPSNYDEKVNNGILDKAFEVEYGYNDAIFYNARLFHNPVIDTYYTRENPRVMMRLCFILRFDEPQEECYHE